MRALVTLLVLGAVSSLPADDTDVSAVGTAEVEAAAFETPEYCTKYTNMIFIDSPPILPVFKNYSTTFEYCAITCDNINCRYFTMQRIEPGYCELWGSDVEALTMQAATGSLLDKYDTFECVLPTSAPTVPPTDPPSSAPTKEMLVLKSSVSSYEPINIPLLAAIIVALILLLAVTAMIVISILKNRKTNKEIREQRELAAAHWSNGESSNGGGSIKSGRTILRSSNQSHPQGAHTPYGGYNPGQPQLSGHQGMGQGQYGQGYTQSYEQKPRFGTVPPMSQQRYSPQRLSPVGGVAPPAVSPPPGLEPTFVRPPPGLHGHLSPADQSAPPPIPPRQNNSYGNKPFGYTSYGESGRFAGYDFQTQSDDEDVGFDVEPRF